MRRRLAVLAGVAAVAALYIASLPASPLELSATGPRQPRGVFHVHTNRSDGAGTPADVAAAAARAGLDFVILTDHGDATRAPNPPSYLDGVLVIDAVEVSTTRGHVVALGLADAAPYPLGGEGRDAVEDIQRLGGLAIAAHIGSPKPELQWTDPAAAIDGIEWINADSEWRDEGAWTLARVLLAYPARSAAALGRVLDRPGPVLAHWDTLLQARRVVGLAAVDAHARIGANEPYDGRLSLRVPSYEAMFRTMTIALESATFTGDPAADAATVVEAIRRGAFFSTIDAIASPGELRITTTGGTLRVVSNAPDGATVVLLRDGDMVTSGPGPALEYALPAAPAVYRVEVRVPSVPGMPPVPWLVSNAIDVQRPEAAVTSAPAPAGGSGTALFADGEAGAWTVERGGEAQAALDAISAAPAGEQLLFRFALGGRVSENPFAAAVVPVTGLSDYRRVTFTARADAPMRLAVQLRVPSPGAGSDGERWRRSVFVDQAPRTITVAFNDLRPVPGAREGQVPLAAVDSLLFVVDLVNTALGASGRVWLDDVRLER